MTEPQTTRRLLLAGAGAAVFTISGCASAAMTNTNGAPIVRVRDGGLAGIARNGVKVFLGVPYGAPTGGARRFLPPEPPARWDGVRDATKLGQRSPQTAAPVYATPGSGAYMSGGRQDELIQMHEPMGEDCLVLNVLTPAVDRSARPVMVYIHGGGFVMGSGAVLTVTDRFVAEHDVVMVTVNHRLGALGYAYLGGLSSRYRHGNPGMLDLISALEWVRDNIHAFGGDPAKVTIFGESGGAAKVALLMAMPQAKGLFRAAIMESGALLQTQSAEAATEAVRAFMRQRSLDPSNVEALQTLPAEDLLQIPVSTAVADGLTLSGSPWRDAAPQTAASLPLLLGHTAHEVSGFVLGIDPSSLGVDWTQLPGKLAAGLQMDFPFLGRVAPGPRHSEAELTPVIAAFRAAYPNDDATSIFLRIMSDQTFGRCMGEVADLKAAQPAPVYFYRFQYDPGLYGLRAFHTAELPLATRMVANPEADPLSRRIAGAWANFARHGDPNGPGLPSWPQYNASTRNIMTFDRDVIPAGPDPEYAARRLLFAITDHA